MPARHPAARILAAAAALLVVALLAAALGGASGNAAAAKPAPCANAQALLDAGYLLAARSAFEADLGKDGCAARGLAAVRAAQSAGHPSGAAKARFAAGVALVRRLEAEGFETEARKQAQTLVEEFPNRAIPADIRSVQQPIGWWRQMKGDVGPPLRLAVEAVIGLLAVVLVALLVAKGVAALAGRVRKRYTVADVTGPVAADIAGQGDVLAAELTRIAGDGGNQIRRVPAADGDFALPDAVAAASPPAAVIAGLLSVLDRLLPRRLLRISAAALPVDRARGVGVTVTITGRDGHQVQGGSVTIWEDELGAVDGDATIAQRVERLMLPAAIWVGYHPELDAKAVRVLGTEEWQSYAHYALGERAQRAGSLDVARRAYYRALDASGGCNVGARLNLAGLLLYRPGGPETEPDPATAAKRLAFAYWLLEDTKMEGLVEGSGERVRWRWYYLRAARSLAARGIAGASPPRSRRPDAEDPATQLWQVIAGAGDAGGLVGEMRWPAFVLHQSAWLERTKAEGDGAAAIDEIVSATENELRGHWWTANTLYNLACFYARAGHIDTAVDRLSEAIDRTTEPKLLLAMATSDPVLDPVTARIGPSRGSSPAGRSGDDVEAKAPAGHAVDGRRQRMSLSLHWW